MNDDLVFLDSVLLQQDMRIRLPKSLLVNINGVPGKTRLEILIISKATNRKKLVAFCLLMEYLLNRYRL